MTHSQRPDRRNLLKAAVTSSALLALANAASAAPKSGELYVVAEIVSKPDAADALRALLVPYAAKSRKEPGCHEYVLMEVESEPGRFQTYERWTGHAALDAHMKTPDMAALAPKLEALLAKPMTQTFLSKPKNA